MAPRLVLITGANSGVGLAIAKVLVASSTSYHVILTARSLAKAQAAVAETLTEIESTTPGATSRLSTLQLDVTDTASITRARDSVEKEFGHLDALINNAAIATFDPDADLQARFRTSMDVNVVGPAVVSSILRPLLLKSDNAYSIFVTSGAGSFGRAVERFKGMRDSPREPPNQSAGAYHVSKAALNMLALREHITYSGDGLKVFAMSPGFVVSNLRGRDEELRTGWGKALPAETAGETTLRILEGERDGDVGCLVREGGVDEW